MRSIFLLRASRVKAASGVGENVNQRDYMSLSVWASNVAALRQSTLVGKYHENIVGLHYVGAVIPV
jgi:hypothetical protein